MREFRTYGSVRGALSNGRSYRDQSLLVLFVNNAVRRQSGTSGLDAAGHDWSWPSAGVKPEFPRFGSSLTRKPWR